MLEKIRERVSTSLVKYSIIMQERYILRVDKPSLKSKERILNVLFFRLDSRKITKTQEEKYHPVKIRKNNR